jgi:glycosyltransferase involved in cell wall biosynthesis
MQVKEYDEVDVILCPSEAVKESFIRRGTDGAKLIVVPHGIKLPEHFPEGTQAHDAGKVRILYTGQIHYRKGLRYLLGALTQTANSALTCRLVGPEFGLSGIDWSQYADIVQKTGPKKGADLWQEYAAADIFVLPSVEEGFGLVVLEAMRAGLPVLITSAVGAKDFVRDGVDGFIVPPRSPEALKEKIVWLLDHPEDRRRMGESARQQANSVQGWDDSATKLVRELAERRKLSVKH